MKPWLETFWTNHGERLVFAALATGFGAFFWFTPEMREEGKTILIMIAGIFVNKVRGPMQGKGE